MIIELNEIINKDRLKKVIACQNIDVDDETDDNLKWRDSFKTMLKKYLKSSKDNYVTIKYTRKTNYGRYHGNGLQKCPREVRKYLSNGNYIDIDISNCHPVILEQLLHKYNISVPLFLNKYNINRDNIIQEYDLKNKFGIFKIMYNENYNTDDKYIKNMHETVYQKLIPNLIQDYSYIYQNINQTLSNKYGSFLSQILQDIENNIIMCVFKKCLDLNMKVGVIVFDGLMIEKNGYNVKYLKELEKTVSEHLNYNIQLVEKNMDTTWLPEKIITNSTQIIKHQFKQDYNNIGDLINIKYSNQIVTGKIIDNDNIKVCHFEHMTLNNKICKGDLLYNVEIDKEVENQIATSVKCNKCGFIHGKKECIQPSVYNVVLNYNINNENPSDLKLIINKTNQLQIHENDKINDLLYESLKQEDITICKILYELYKDKCLLVQNTWYIYNGIIWVQIKDVYPNELLYGIEDIKNELNNLYEKHHYECNLSNDQLKLLSKICDNISKKMMRNNEDISYVSASKKFFSQNSLDVVFNENTHLIALQNGIFDLNTFQFRQGIPSDYLTIQLSFLYKDIDPVKKEFVLTFLKDILPIDAVRDFLLLNVSSCLLGTKNKEQEFYILTGKKGANGKSVLTTFIENTFGYYFAAPEPTIITKPREKANEANEAMIHLHGKRIAIMSEPHKRDKILSDNLKKFTGGDSITARGLHKSSQKVKLNLKIFMLCNSIPLLDDCKDAEIRRLCIINFPNKFCTHPKKHNEKLIDENISDKLNNCLNEFFHILLEYLHTYQLFTTSGQSLPKPDDVTKQLKQYIEKNKNDIDEFIEEHLQSTHNHSLGCNLVWTTYNQWCLLHNKQRVKQQILEEAIEDFFDIDTKTRVTKGYTWHHISLKEE